MMPLTDSTTNFLHPLISTHTSPYETPAPQ
jgi:hypothetical protein